MFRLLIIIFALITNFNIFSQEYTRTYSHQFSAIVGGEQDFRGVDHATFLSKGFLIKNIVHLKNNFSVELYNSVWSGDGYYYINNPYSVAGKYKNATTHYFGSISIAKTFLLKSSKLKLGLGGSIRNIWHTAIYNKLDIFNGAIVPGAWLTDVLLQYRENGLPLSINYEKSLCDDIISISFNNIIPIGFRGLMTHTFKGSGGFVKKSWHSSWGIISDITLNYYSFSVGPWISWNVFSRGKWNNKFTMPSGNQLKLLEYGLIFSYKNN